MGRKLAVTVALLLLILLMISTISFEMHKHESRKELERAHEELLNEHLELLSRYNRLKVAYEELKARFEELKANYSEAWFRANVYWKALMFLGNRSILLRLNVSAPYEKGFKFGVIEVEIPLWKYALYKVCDNPKRLGLDPYNDTVLYDVVAKVREWLIREGLFDEERFANALVSIAQLLPYNESVKGRPVETLVEGGVCTEKAFLAVALLRIAGYEACVLGINAPPGHDAIAIHLSKPPRFAIADDPWYVVFKGRRYYVVESVSRGWPITIGTPLWPSAFKEGLIDMGWPYHGEKPEKIHAPPYREE